MFVGIGVYDDVFLDYSSIRSCIVEEGEGEVDFLDWGVWCIGCESIRCEN